MSQPTADGSQLIRASWMLTALLVVAGAAMVFDPNRLGFAGAAVAVAMFVGGSLANAWAFAVAVQRSRREEISVPGLWFLTSGVAPPAVRRSLHSATAAQFLVGVTAAGLRPFTIAAFAVLAHVAGLGIGGLWGARHGAFPPKPDA